MGQKVLNMRKIVVTNTTKNKVKAWLDKLSKPNKKISNMPICPFIGKYRNRIHIAQTTKPEDLANNFAHMKDVFQFEAVVAFGFWMSYDKMDKMITTLNKKLAHKDTICLMMHPDGDESVLPVDYQFELPILIIQRLSTLNKARKQLEKTKYYKHYKY